MYLCRCSLADNATEKTGSTSSFRGASASEIATALGVKRQTVSDAVRRFEETGKNKNRAGSGRTRIATDNEHREQVANAIAQCPSTKINSSHKLARICSISGKSTHRLLKSLQSLKEALQREWDRFSMESIRRIVYDFARRIEACIEARGKYFE